jgi:microcystin-dependent protein
MPWVSGSYTKGNAGSNGWSGDASLGIGIEANRHDAQDNDFATGINNCLAKDGTNAATGNLDLGNKKVTNLAGGTANGDGINVAQLNALIPPGSVITTAATSAPSGWLLCDGTAVNRTTYAALFAVISTTYGAGDGSTTFNLPDLRRRTPVGVGASDSVATTDGVAYASRSATQTHSIPPHYHGMGTGADLNITSSGSGTTGNDSPDHTHNIGIGFTATDKGWTITGAGTAGYTQAGTTTSTGASARHTHSTPAHTHPSGNIAGSIGLVTGGVNGNATMTSGAGQYIYMNYIIKH